MNREFYVTEVVDCDTCKGSGKIHQDQKDINFHEKIWFSCQDCTGGKLYKLIHLDEALAYLNGAENPINKSTAAITDVLDERERQFIDKGFNFAHDDQHDHQELARAAISYALHYVYRCGIPESSFMKDQPHLLWPWAEKWWKPKTPRHDLVRAAALLLAEIERIDRAAIDAGQGL